MRQGKIEINGQIHPMCISGRVIYAIQDKYQGSWEKGLNKIMNSGNIADYYWLAAQMMDAAKKYCDKVGLEAPEPPTEDDLVDLMGIDDIEALARAVLEAATGSSEPEVVLEGDKKEKKEQPVR